MSHLIPKETAMRSQWIKDSYSAPLLDAMYWIYRTYFR
jgi:hypothetical protein